VVTELDDEHIALPADVRENAALQAVLEILSTVLRGAGLRLGIIQTASGHAGYPGCPRLGALPLVPRERVVTGIAGDGITKERSQSCHLVLIVRLGSPHRWPATLPGGLGLANPAHDPGLGVKACPERAAVIHD
jgi:hypothetical protein